MPENRHIRILSVDDHPLLREGIAATINAQSDMALVAEATSGREALNLFREHRPDVTLMDLRLPDMSGIEATIAIRAEYGDARVIILTTFEGDAEIQRALEGGASGYLLKSMPPRELVAGIREVHAGRKCLPPQVLASLAEHLGEQALTHRELEVLRALVRGGGNRDIAKGLFISEETVKVHIRHILEKLGAADRTEAVTIAVRRGIIEI